MHNSTLNNTGVTNVIDGGPCVINGSLFGPSQQSSSTDRALANNVNR